MVICLNKRNVFGRSFGRAGGRSEDVTTVPRGVPQYLPYTWKQDGSHRYSWDIKRGIYSGVLLGHDIEWCLPLDRGAFEMTGPEVDRGWMGEDLRLSLEPV